MISTIPQVVGAVGVIASLLVLAWQTRQLRQQILSSENVGRTEAHYNSIERYHDALKLIAQYPELRPYFYESMDCPLSDPHHPRALVVAEMLVDALDYGIRIGDRFPEQHQPSGWFATALRLYEQPVVRQVVGAHPEWWPDLTRYLTANLPTRTGNGDAGVDA